MGFARVWINEVQISEDLCNRYFIGYYNSIIYQAFCRNLVVVVCTSVFSCTFYAKKKIGQLDLSGPRVKYHMVT